MKKSNKFMVAILSVIIAGILFSVPISFLMDKQSFAADDNSAKVVSTTTNNDYIFVLLEDEAVPLAAAPIANPVEHKILFTVLLMLASISVISYSYWYIMIRSNIKTYSYAVTNSELKRIIPSNSFFHPVELSNAEREILFRAATK